MTKMIIRVSARDLALDRGRGGCGSTFHTPDHGGDASGSGNSHSDAPADSTRGRLLSLRFGSFLLSMPDPGTRSAAPADSMLGWSLPRPLRFGSRAPLAQQPAHDGLASSVVADAAASTEGLLVQERDDPMLAEVKLLNASAPSSPVACEEDALILPFAEPQPEVTPTSPSHNPLGDKVALESRPSCTGAACLAAKTVNPATATGLPHQA
ncbi:hypothetical protein PVAP13_1KG162315 [Panicum virgatum]|uniref:Uncharacterized protein n=1 Tax=Panicum virgatum TaxID=38727 RepID=A0A8T0XFD3_PANVG|nr:hypothetical protein PVAP13_1KG162315 [Panicum virgatum]